MALNVDVIVSLLLLLSWSVVGWLVGGLAAAPGRRIGRRSGSAVWAGGFALLVVVAKLVTTALLANSGWVFAADRVLLVLPVVVAPAAAFCAVALPVLWRTRRLPRDSGERVAGAARLRLAALAVALPAPLTALGGAVAFYAALLSPPVPPYLDDAATLWLPYLAVGLVLLVRVVRRRDALRDGNLRRRGLGVRALRSVGVTVAVLLVLGVVVVSTRQGSALPARYSMTEHLAAGSGHTGHDGIVAAGGSGALVAGGGAAVAPTSVADLTGPTTGEPDRRFTLTAQAATVRLASGATVEGWTFNGQSPGPLLRGRQGELVEITVQNRDVARGISTHWHGIDVPNAEDGVPGLTQDAIGVGQSHTYRFRLDDAGTYWYHSHQVSSEQVERGLYGMFVVEPRDAVQDPSVLDIPVIGHSWRIGGQQVRVIGTDDVLARRAVPPGTRVRLRLLNTDSNVRTFSLTGTPFRVVALDGRALNGPTDLTGALLPIGGGGRYDLELTMPDHPVRLADAFRPNSGLSLSPDGTGDIPAQTTGKRFDPAAYGTPAPTPFGPDSAFDQTTELYLDNRPGFYDTQLGLLWTVNGQVFPDIPAITVRQGELVRMRFVNRSRLEHPMHLHGHHVLLLSRNGRPVTGSPIWLDTVTVPQGEDWEVGFVADNPGIWMDHCHNLDHAAIGMVLHLAYEGVTTPYVVGSDTPNQPE